MPLLIARADHSLESEHLVDSGDYADVEHAQDHGVNCVHFHVRVASDDDDAVDGVLEFVHPVWGKRAVGPKHTRVAEILCVGKLAPG